MKMFPAAFLANKMTRYILTNLVVIITCGACWAQYSEQYNSCIKKATTQGAMNVCANDELLRVDAELNSTYKKLLLAAGDRSSAVEKIKTAERAWIVYRNAYIEAMFPAEDKQSEYGSRFPMEVSLLQVKLTKKQNEALKDLLIQHGGLR